MDRAVEPNKSKNYNPQLIPPLWPGTSLIRREVRVQARRQDLAAGGKEPEGGAKNQEGPHLKNTVLDVCSKRGPNVKWGGTGQGTTGPPAGDSPARV